VEQKADAPIRCFRAPERIIGNLLDNIIATIPWRAGSSGVWGRGGRTFR
jgi:hypothetical protein